MSYLDLLPEEPIPLPDRATKGLQKKKFCLTEHKCAGCGKEFTLPWGARGYVRSVCGKELKFCTWACLRKDERERTIPKAGKRRKPVPERIAYLEQKNAEDYARLEGEGAAALTKKQIRAIRNRISARRQTILALREGERPDEDA